MSGKWFADNFDHVVEFGQKLGHGVDPKFYVVEVDIPDEIVNRAFRVSGNQQALGGCR